MQQGYHQKAKANAAFLLSMVIFGTIGIFRKYIPLPSGLIACSRGLIGTLFLLVFVKIRGIHLSVENIRKNGWKLFLSGVFLGFNWILLFEAYRYTSVAVTTLCYYMAPILVVLVSPLLFGEKLTPKKMICVLVALCGMILVSGVVESFLAAGTTASSSETGEPQNLKGVVLGLGAAVLYASVVLMNKKITEISSYEKTIVQLGTAAVVILPYTILTETVEAQAWSFSSTVCLLLVGVIHTGVAYALYFGAVSDMKAQTAALFSYLDPVVAILLSVILLGETLSITNAVGAVLILGAALLCELGGDEQKSQSMPILDESSKA